MGLCKYGTIPSKYHDEYINMLPQKAMPDVFNEIDKEDEVDNF